MLGNAEKVVIDKENTTIVNGAGSKKPLTPVAQIRKQMEITTSDYDKEKLQERLAKLSGGVAVLYVGAASEVEMKSKKDRVEDALNATRAAIEEGFVPGGGVAYLRAIPSLKKIKADNEDEATGVAIVARAIEEPLRMIVENAARKAALLFKKYAKEKVILVTMPAQTNMKIFLPRVLSILPRCRVALENAGSVAGMFLTTECVLAEKKEENPAPVANPGMGGMGGMM
jgi:chaperonin GroEL